MTFPEEVAAFRSGDLHPSLSDPVLGTMTFLNEVTLRYPEAISFAPGRPWDGFFDPEEVFVHLRRYLDHLAAGGHTREAITSLVFQYGTTAGQIRSLIADSLRDDEGIRVPPEAIVVTVGGQEAMLLALRTLMSGPDDALLVVAPCYVGITGAARLLDVPVLTVRERETGLDCADLEAAVRAARDCGYRPRAVYVVPDFSNPSGSTLPVAARQDLLRLAARHDLVVLEDSPYRLVSPVRPLPTLKALDTGRRVIHIGSFSKTIFPGVRVGFVVADQQVTRPDGGTGLLAEELAKVKSMVTVNTSSLSQAVVGGALLAASGRVSRMVAGSARRYGETMSCTLQQLDEQFPEPERNRLGVGWNRPEGGFFLTMRTPFVAGEAALERSAREFGVLWTPMSYFYPDGGGERALRLSTSYLTRDQIRDGVSRLVNFVQAEVRGTGC